MGFSVPKAEKRDITKPSINSSDMSHETGIMSRNAQLHEELESLDPSHVYSIAESVRREVEGCAQNG